MTTEDELKLAKIFINHRGHTVNHPGDGIFEDAVYHYVKEFIEEQRDAAISLAEKRAEEIVKIVLKENLSLQKEICDSISRKGRVSDRS